MSFDTNLSSLNITSNETSSSSNPIPWIYTEGIGILMIICTISTIVNTRVLVSVHWIKRPLSATLYISLSLAAADLVTSIIVFTNFFLNSYLYVVQEVQIPICIALTFEAFRLGGIVNTVLHLMLLACNHYLGIVRPLHYQSIMTRGKISGFLITLWVLPPVYMLIYFSADSDEGFRVPNCSYIFMTQFEFRVMFSLLLVIPLILMTFIYTHILLIVHRQQRSWKQAAEHGASFRNPGRGTMKQNRSQTRRRFNQNQEKHHRKQQLVRNVKAVYTTLFILGSFVVGLLPPMLVFVLVCETCAFKSSEEGYWTELFWFVNLMLVTKPLANPIIYAARMPEIKEATWRMRRSLCYSGGKCHCCSPILPLLWLCCGWNSYQRNTNLNEGTQSTIADRDGSSINQICTQLCPLVSNGHSPPVKNVCASSVL